MTSIEVPLVNRAGVVRGVALIDDLDAPLILGSQWRLHSAGYAARSTTRTTIYMHRVIMDAHQGIEVDHRNRNKLDNTRANLRLVTHAENHQNHAARGGSSRYRNVSFCQGAWQVSIRINGTKHYLGRFADEHEANAAAVAYRREHAPFAVEEAA